jgi:hypothetical protein
MRLLSHGVPGAELSKDVRKENDMHRMLLKGLWAPAIAQIMRHWRGALAGLGISVITFALLILIEPWANPLRQTQAAWDTRPFADYRVHVIHTYQRSEIPPTRHMCEAYVEVRTGETPLLIGGDCTVAWTVEKILARVEPYADTPVAARSCPLFDCTCARSTLVVEHALGTGYPRRIARDWRDATVTSGPIWRLLVEAPAPVRRGARTLAQFWNSCPSGMEHYARASVPVYREEFQFLSLEPLKLE